MSNELKSRGFPHQPDQSANGDPLDALANDFDKASQEFDRGRREAESDGGRTGAVMALFAAIKYLSNVRPDIDAKLLPLHLLATSLADLSIGKKDAMLAPFKRNGRPPTSVKRELLQEIAACAVSILMDGGWNERNAERYVANKLKSGGVQIDPPTVGNWRSAILEHLPRDCGYPGRLDNAEVRHHRLQRGGLFLRIWRDWQTYRDHLSGAPLVFVNFYLDGGVRDFG